MVKAMFSLPVPRHMPCERCGASIERDDLAHTCDDERRLQFELFPLRAEIEMFDEHLRRWLETACGRFERFYAERTRPA
jgi:hypothetical protein